MKKIYLILLVIILFGGLGAVAFFVTKKKRDNKKNSPKAPVITPEEKAAIVPSKSDIAPSIPQKPLVKESLEMDIKVPHVDVLNRRFDYSMHYKGIPCKGTFEDGITNMVHVKKSFGSFVVSQRKNLKEEHLARPDRYHVPVGRNTAKDQKIRGGAKDLGIIMTEDTTMGVSTKGGAVRAGAVQVDGGKNIPLSIDYPQRSGITSLNSDWVDLFIADAQDGILKQLSVNLRTGETTNANIQF